MAAMAQVDAQLQRLQQTRLCLLASMLPAGAPGSNLLGGWGDADRLLTGPEPAGWEGAGLSGDKGGILSASTLQALLRPRAAGPPAWPGAGPCA